MENRFHGNRLGIMYEDGYINGFVERKDGGRYEGNLTIDGVSLSPVEAVYFKDNGITYLWLKRKPILEYDSKTMKYTQRKREPQWEAYLQQQKGVVAYKGEFFFLRFKYSIIGIWDSVLGKEKQRLNLFVEKLPMSQQTIINKINERNSND